MLKDSGNPFRSVVSTSSHESQPANASFAVANVELTIPRSIFPKRLVLSMWRMARRKALLVNVLSHPDLGGGASIQIRLDDRNGIPMTPIQDVEFPI